MRTGVPSGLLRSACRVPRMPGAPAPVTNRISLSLSLTIHSPFDSHHFEGLSVCGANLCPAYFRQAEDEVSGKIGALQLQLALIGFEGFPLAFYMPLVEHYKCLGGKADVVPRQLVSPQGQVFERPDRLGVKHLVVLVNISAGRDKNRFRLE